MDHYCLQCDDSTPLHYGVRDINGWINAQAYTVETIAGWHCPVCGEVEFDTQTDSATRHFKVIEALNR